MRTKGQYLAATVLLVATTVVAQRTSPQFSFPPPNQPLGQFGSDLFTSAGQDLTSQPAGPQSTLVQLPPAPPLPLQPEPQPQLVAQSLPLPPAQPSAQFQPQTQQQSARSQEAVGSGPQLSRPSLSLSSQSAPQLQQSAPNARQPAASQQQVVASSQPAQSSFSSSSSTAASQSSQGSSAQARSHQQLHPAPSKRPGRHNQHPANVQPAASQSGGGQSHQAESGRKAEATAASLAASAGQSYHCPDSFGYFRHHKSCDKYWACENETATLKLCGNGLMFDDSDPRRENCAYPFSVDCGSDRTDLEPPISTPHCPRLYGLFADTSNCRVFYSCWNGEASRYECPPGLAYDNEQRVCVWADLVDRCEQSEVSDGFVCPDPTEADQPGHYTRHAHPTDCRKFYVCIDAVARPYGCSFGTVFNVDSLQCDEPENVSGCEKYYGDLDPKLAKKLARENAHQSGAGSGQASSSSPSSRTQSSTSSPSNS